MGLRAKQPFLKTSVVDITLSGAGFAQCYLKRRTAASCGAHNYFLEAFNENNQITNQTFIHRFHNVGLRRRLEPDERELLQLQN